LNYDEKGRKSDYSQENHFIYTLNIDNNCLFDSKIVINGKG